MTRIPRQGKHRVYRNARLGSQRVHVASDIIHHQVPDLEQTLAAMPLQTSLSSDNFNKFKPLLCPPVAELQRLSRNVILCLPLSRLPSTFPVEDKNSKPLRLHTCPTLLCGYNNCFLSLTTDEAFSPQFSVLCEEYKRFEL